LFYTTEITIHLRNELSEFGQKNDLQGYYNAKQPLYLKLIRLILNKN